MSCSKDPLDLMESVDLLEKVDSLDLRDLLVLVDLAVSLVLQERGDRMVNLDLLDLVANL